MPLHKGNVVRIFSLFTEYTVCTTEHKKDTALTSPNCFFQFLEFLFLKSKVPKSLGGLDLLLNLRYRRYGLGRLDILLNLRYRRYGCIFILLMYMYEVLKSKLQMELAFNIIHNNGIGIQYYS